MRRQNGKDPLGPVRDVRLGIHQYIARDSHDPFVWSATGRGRQRPGQIRDVNADDGEIAALDFPNIRAIVATDALRAVGVRVRADAFDKNHGEYVTVVSYYVNSFLAYFFGVNTHKSYAELCECIVRLLCAERKRQGLSKYAVERRSGLSQQMIGYVERGLRRPSLETALRMADGLGLDLAVIITQARDDTPKRKP